MVCPELTEQIRREVAASLHQRKGDFTCYFLTDLVTFTLPAGQHLISKQTNKYDQKHKWFGEGNWLKKTTFHSQIHEYHIMNSNSYQSVLSLFCIRGTCDSVAEETQSSHPLWLAKCVIECLFCLLVAYEIVLLFEC